MHRLSHLFGDLQERLDQPQGRRIRLVQQRRDQAGHRLSQGVGEPEEVERRLAAQGQRQDRAAHGRQMAHPGQDLRQPRPARDRRLLRALRLRLRPPADGAGDEAFPHRPAAFADHRQADGEDRMGPELGGNPRRRILEAVTGHEFRGDPEGDLRPVRKHLHDVPAEAVRALPQPHLRGRLSFRRDLQARGRRHRPHRPGQVPGLADVRLGLPVQEDLLQLGLRQIGEMHLLLPAHRGRPADRLFGDLRRPHPLSWRSAL